MATGELEDPPSERAAHEGIHLLGKALTRSHLASSAGTGAGSRVDTYLGQDEQRDLFVLLDEWNAYSWALRAARAAIARDGCRWTESDVTNAPLEFAYFVERYLERHRRDGPDVFRALLAQDSVRAVLRTLIAETRPDLTPDPLYACLGNARLTALRAAAAASLDRLAEIASSSR